MSRGAGRPIEQRREIRIPAHLRLGAGGVVACLLPGELGRGAVLAAVSEARRVVSQPEVRDVVMAAAAGIGAAPGPAAAREQHRLNRAIVEVLVEDDVSDLEVLPWLDRGASGAGEQRADQARAQEGQRCRAGAQPTTPAEAFLTDGPARLACPA